MVYCNNAMHDGAVFAPIASRAGVMRRFAQVYDAIRNGLRRMYSCCGTYLALQSAYSSQIMVRIRKSYDQIYKFPL